MELFSCQEEYKCFAYGRLSKEDGDKIESDSITNQRELIHSYIGTTPGLRLCMEGFDDGYAGTNFQRPHFQEMLTAITEKKVNCVVVKDLSRFGREYIGAGRYIQRLFPSLGVRFIAINDNYDSARQDASDNLMLSFKNLINDSFCRDTSLKIRSHLDVKRRNGDFIGSFAVYGYNKDPANKCRLVADPEAAAVVLDIFAWKIDGMSNQAIADRLNSLGILSPREYKRAQGLRYESGYKVHAKTLWSSVAVRRILTNPVYLGVMEQGKRTTPNYKVKKVVERPPEEWMVVEDTHEAIVSQADFELAGRLLLFDTRSSPGESTVHPLAGLLCCGDCMGTMARKTQTCDSVRYTYYVCAQHKTDKAFCTQHSISAQRLEGAVLAGVNLHIQSVIDLKKALTALQSRPSRKLETKKLQRRLAALEEELDRTRDLKDALYRRFALGEVTLEDFTEFKRIFTRDCETVEGALAAQKAQLDGILNSGAPDSPWIAHFSQFGRAEALTRPLAVKLIERVCVYENERVELVFRYQAEYEMALQFLALQSDAGDLGEVV